MLCCSIHLVWTYLRRRNQFLFRYNVQLICSIHQGQWWHNPSSTMELQNSGQLAVAIYTLFLLKKNNEQLLKFTPRCTHPNNNTRYILKPIMWFSSSLGGSSCKISTANDLELCKGTASLEHKIAEYLRLGNCASCQTLNRKVDSNINFPCINLSHVKLN